METLEIFPNPGREMLTINMDDLKGQPGNIYFYNAKGVLVEKMVLCAESSCRINTENLAPGVYMIQIVQDDIRYFSKWVKI